MYQFANWTVELDELLLDELLLDELLLDELLELELPVMDELDTALELLDAEELELCATEELEDSPTTHLHTSSPFSPKITPSFGTPGGQSQVHSQVEEFCFSPIAAHG